jgi:hypothetical protein
MSTSKVLVLIFGFICTVFFIVALFVRRDYKIERKLQIDRPVEQVFDYVRILDNQEEYNLWYLIDPPADKVRTGKDGTLGYVLAWDSDDIRLGKGEEKIVNFKQFRRIDIAVRFKRPLPFTDYIYFITEMTPDNNTVLTWGIHGERMYPTNIVYLYYEMNKLLTYKLERSINKIKRNLEY